jgi:hypothetical protein
MDTVLGLLGVVAWIAIVIALAAAVTYIVVRISPGDRDEAATPKST